jgi:hypothetical protein
MPDDPHGHRALLLELLMARHLPRPRYLRAFVLWLAARSDQLPVRLHRVLTRRNFLVYRLAGYPPELEIVVSTGEVSVMVMHEGHCWDILTCFESSAAHDDQGYRCKLCPPGGTSWPDRVGVWRDHDFEPLASWLHSALAPAGRLELHCLPGIQWAALCSAGSQADAGSLTSTFTLPCHADMTNTAGHDHA